MSGTIDTYAIHAKEVTTIADSTLGKPSRGTSSTELAEIYLRAAAGNDVAALKDAERQIIMGSSNHTYFKRTEQEGLIRAAENNAPDTTQYIYQQCKTVRGSKESQSLAESAFITACRFDSLKVASFYQTSVDLRPEVVAWGLYRAPASGVVRELLTSLMEPGSAPRVSYDIQQEFLRLATTSDLPAVRERVDGLKRTNFPQVFREAAELAVRHGDKAIVQIMIPEMPVMWLPELTRIAGQQGHTDIAEEIIVHGEGLNRQHSGAEWPGSDVVRSLRKEAVKGAAENGQLGTVDTLVASEYWSTSREDLYTAAAKAAIPCDQGTVLAHVLPHVRDERNYPDFLSAAVDSGADRARRILMHDLGDKCVTSSHIIKAAVNDDTPTFYGLMRITTSQSTLDSALKRMADRIETQGDKFGLHYVLNLFDRASPDAQGEIFRAYGATDNDKDLEVILLGRDWSLFQSHIDEAFYGAVLKGRRKIFDVLLFSASVEGKTEAFDNIIRRNTWVEARAFIPALIDGGIQDPNRLTNAAISMSKTEGPIAGQPSPAESPATTAIIGNKAFPLDRLNEVLVEIGDGGNQPAIKALLARGGNKDIPDFYAAASNSDISSMAYYITRVPPEVLERAARSAIWRGDNIVLKQLLERATDKLKTPSLVTTMITAGNFDAVKIAVTNDAEVESESFSWAVSANNPELVITLLRAKNGLESAREYLEEVRSQEEDGVAREARAPMRALIRDWLYPGTNRPETPSIDPDGHRLG